VQSFILQNMKTQYVLPLIFAGVVHGVAQAPSTLLAPATSEDILRQMQQGQSQQFAAPAGGTLPVPPPIPVAAPAPIVPPGIALAPVASSPPPVQPCPPPPEGYVPMIVYYPMNPQNASQGQVPVALASPPPPPPPVPSSESASVNNTGGPMQVVQAMAPLPAPPPPPPLPPPPPVSPAPSPASVPQSSNQIPVFVGIDEGDISEFKCPKGQIVTQIVGKHNNSGILEFQARCNTLQPLVNATEGFKKSREPNKIPDFSKLSNQQSQTFGKPGNNTKLSKFQLPYVEFGLFTLDMSYDNTRVTSISYANGIAGFPAGQRKVVRNLCPVVGVAVKQDKDGIIKAIRFDPECPQNSTNTSVSKT
jgi:hypothetical protein